MTADTFHSLSTPALPRIAWLMQLTESATRGHLDTERLRNASVRSIKSFDQAGACQPMKSPHDTVRDPFIGRVELAAILRPLNHTRAPSRSIRVGYNAAAARDGKTPSGATEQPDLASPARRPCTTNYLHIGGSFAADLHVAYGSCPAPAIDLT